MDKVISPLDNSIVCRQWVLWDEKDDKRTGDLDACEMSIMNMDTGEKIRIQGLGVLENLKVALDKQIFLVKLMRKFTYITEEEVTELYLQGMAYEDAEAYLINEKENEVFRLNT